MDSGRLAAGACLAASESPERAGAEYARLVEREIAPDLRTARRLARLVYHHPRLRRAVFRLRGAALCEAMVEVVAGRLGYRALLRDPRNYLKLLGRTR